MCKKKWMVCLWVLLGIALAVLVYVIVRAEGSRDEIEGTFVQAFSAAGDRCGV